MLAPELTAGFSRIRPGGREPAPGSHERPSAPVHAADIRRALAVAPADSYPFDRAGFELLISRHRPPSTLQLASPMPPYARKRGVARSPLRSFVRRDRYPAWPPSSHWWQRRSVAQRDWRSQSLSLSAPARAFEEWNATLPGGPVRPAAITIVDSAGLGLKAAIDGAGITLAGAEIAGADIGARRLVPFFDHRIAGEGYYLVYPRALRTGPSDQKSAPMAGFGNPGRPVNAGLRKWKPVPG